MIITQPEAQAAVASHMEDAIAELLERWVDEDMADERVPAAPAA